MAEPLLQPSKKAKSITSDVETMVLILSAISMEILLYTFPNVSHSVPEGRLLCSSSISNLFFRNKTLTMFKVKLWVAINILQNLIIKLESVPLCCYSLDLSEILKKSFIINNFDKGNLVFNENCY